MEDACRCPSVSPMDRFLTYRCRPVAPRQIDERTMRVAPIAGQLPMSEKGLGCVKTVTRKKCRKYSSPPRASSSRAQYDSAVMTENCPVIFYARDGCRSFHTAKTHV